MTTTSSTSTSSTSTSTATTTTTSNASIGQSILSSLNANGAGIDTDTLVTNLTAAQKSAIETPITTKQTANTAQISSAATLASDITAFNSIVSTLVSGGTLQTQPSSSNTSAMTVSAVTGTLVGSLSSSITVEQLAKAQTLQSTTGYSSTDTFKGGTLTFNVGTAAGLGLNGATADGSATTSLTVNVTDGSSLSDIAKAINAQATGFTASVVSNSSGASTLVIKGATGAAQAFTVTGADATSGTSTGTNSLSAFSYTGGSGTSGFTSAQASQDAKLNVDGVEITRSSNSFSDVVNGVQMNLVGTGTLSLGSTRPTSAITAAINDLVSDYNSILTDINTATAAATSSSDAGPLRGNSAIRELKTALSKLTTTPLNASGSIRTLAELGVKTAQDGTLSVDSTTLSNMLAKYPDDVEAMFVTSQTSSSSKAVITNTAGAVASGVYTVTGVLDTDHNNGTAAGSIDGVAMTGSSWNLTAPAGSSASGLTLQLLSGVPSSLTVTINQGLGGVLQAIASQLTGKTGSLTTLQSSLATQQTTLADALTKAEDQVTVYHDRLVTQFTQMNTLVSGYKATQSYLTQQVDLWTKSDS